MSRVVVTSGVFDLLHEGHLATLAASKAMAEPGGQLIVGVLTDRGSEAYKRTPVLNEHVRLQIISSLEMVDAAFLQPGTDPSSFLRALIAIGIRPSVFTHGADWSALREGNSTLAELGIEFRTTPYIEGTSTTNIIKRVRLA